MEGGVGWNCWHGCKRLSAGCLHCYVYRQDEQFGTAVGSDVVRKTAAFDLPVRRNRRGEWKVPAGSVFYTCFTSDFFLEEADAWRAEAWDMIRRRRDCRFMFFTKRISRFWQCVPEDWGDGWEHVAIGCSVENEEMARVRLPIFLEVPVKHRYIVAAPMLGRMGIGEFLDGRIEEVSVGGESGYNARVLDYEWVLDLRRQCVERGVPFRFHQTGAFLRKDGRVYFIRRRFQHSQALKAGLNVGVRF